MKSNKAYGIPFFLGLLLLGLSGSGIWANGADAGSGPGSSISQRSNDSNPQSMRQRVRRARQRNRSSADRERQGRDNSNSPRKLVLQMEDSKRFLRQKARGRKSEDAVDALGRPYNRRNWRMKVTEAEKSIETEDYGDTPVEEQQLEVISSADEEELARRKNEKNDQDNGFLAAALAGGSAAAGAVVGAAVGSGSLGGILCLTGAICPGEDTSETVEVDTSGEIIFDGLERPPTDAEFQAVIDQLQDFYEREIARAFGAVVTTPGSPTASPVMGLGRQTDTDTELETVPIQFLGFELVDRTNTTTERPVTFDRLGRVVGQCTNRGTSNGRGRFSRGRRRARYNRHLQTFEVDNQLVDLAIQRADFEVFVNEYLVRLPASSVYRSVRVDNIEAITTTTPVPSSAPTDFPSVGPSAIPTTTTPTTVAPTTSAPTTAVPTTAAPTTAAPTAPRVVTVAGNLFYGFFDGTTVREPTMEEIVGLVDQTNAFYNVVFETAYPNYSTGSAALFSVVDTLDDPTSFYPVSLTFFVTLSFLGESSIPTSLEVLTVMQNADYQDYIRNYVWNSEPLMTSLFYNTQRVNFGAIVEPAPSITPAPQPTGTPSAIFTTSAPTVPPLTSAPTKDGDTNAPTSPMTSAPTKEGDTNAPTAFLITTVRSVPARLAYAFFAQTTIRQPTFEEINGLITQTSAFYDLLLRAVYPTNYFPGSASADFVQEDFVENNNYPVSYDFFLEATFTTDNANTPTIEQIFIAMESGDYLAYITEFVWNSAPQGSSIFFDTQMVIFTDFGFNVGSSATATAAASMPSSSSIFRERESFNFDDNPKDTLVFAGTTPPTNPPTDIPSGQPTVSPSTLPTQNAWSVSASVPGRYSADVPDRNNQGTDHSSAWSVSATVPDRNSRVPDNSGSFPVGAYVANRDNDGEDGGR